ncbi:hypothetical protein RRG08_018721 [Elysia crispata]|uniref:Uncharacterized protein n=1 Tax=Elysia crispata TaxID=231223 RepID=A0AAE0XQ45_9GAST|nr:hypothetical protein RRG08_018721 [Elysia crispata]
MAWYTVFSLLIFLLRNSSGNPVLTPIKFEYTRSCSDDYLVEKEDFMVFVFEATGNNSAYPFHHAFYGPQFQYTTTTSDDFISPCSAIDLGSVGLVWNNKCGDAEEGNTHALRSVPSDVRNQRCIDMTQLEEDMDVISGCIILRRIVVGQSPKSSDREDLETGPPRSLD